MTDDGVTEVTWGEHSAAFDDAETPAITVSKGRRGPDRQVVATVKGADRARLALQLAIWRAAHDKAALLEADPYWFAVCLTHDLETLAKVKAVLT